MASFFWVGTGNWNAADATNWAATSGGAGGAGVPGSADIAFFDALSGTGTVMLASDVTVRAVNCSGFGGTMAWNGHVINVAGNGLDVWTGSAAMTVTGTPIVNLTYSGATSTRGIRGAAVSEANSVSFNVTAGTDIVAMATGASAVKNLDFTGFAGTLTFSVAYIAYGNVTFSTGMTITAGTNALTFAATSAKTITTNGKTLDIPLIFNGIGGAFSFADALTQGSTRAFTITNGTVKLKAGATSTVGALATSGSNQKTLQSTTPGSQATLSQASGTVNASRLTIKDIAATGGATFNAPRSSSNIDSGGNTGWNFGPALGTGAGLSLAMRVGL